MAAAHSINTGVKKRTDSILGVIFLLQIMIFSLHENFSLAKKDSFAIRKFSYKIVKQHLIK